MKQPTFEFLLENNPLRRYVRKVLEVKPLRAAAGVGRINRALHVACGNGSSTQLILKYFSAEKVSAVDRDKDLIGEARKNNAGDAVEFSVQDVRSFTFEDNSFDAAFVLGDLHNFENWKGGVRELQRVLRPGGLLIMEDLSQETFTYAAGRLFKVLAAHDYDSMLTTAGFRDYVLQIGFTVLHFEERIPFGLLKYFTMVARKTSLARA